MKACPELVEGMNWRNESSLHLQPLLSQPMIDSPQGGYIKPSVFCLALSFPML